MASEVVMNPDWEHLVAQAAKPALDKLAVNCNTYIDSPPEGPGVDAGGAPVVTGNLRDASEAVVEIDTEGATVLLGVDTVKAPYADVVIKGDSAHHGNHYLDRALAFGVQTIPGGD